MSISVVFYCFKNKEYLEHSLVTLLNQTFSDWEAIVINDGFTYFPESSIPTAQQEKFKIVTLKQPIGFVKSCLVALPLARREACVFLRGVDFQASDRLRDQWLLLNSNPVDHVFNVPRYFDEKGVRSASSLSTLSKRPFVLGHQLYQVVTDKAPIRGSFCLSSFMFRTKTIDLENTRRLIASELRPKRLMSEALFLRELSIQRTRGGLCNPKELVTVNCKEDVSFYEEDDSLDWQEQEIK